MKEGSIAHLSVARAALFAARPYPYPTKYFRRGHTFTLANHWKMAGQALRELELFGPQYVASIATPVGKLWVESDGERIVRTTFNNPGRGRHGKAPKVLTEAIIQLRAYFAGRRKKFDLPLYQVGSPYRRKVWEQLGQIHHGDTASYAQLATKAGGSPRSVGAVCAVNPLLILVPCHRAVGSNGLLVGYAGGLWRKKWLLQHECALAKELF